MTRLISWCSWRKFSAIRVVIYTVLLPVSYFTGWLKSVSYVAVLSVIALIESAIAAWRADVPNKPKGDEIE